MNSSIGIMTLISWISLALAPLITGIILFNYAVSRQKKNQIELHAFRNAMSAGDERIHTYESQAHLHRLEDELYGTFAAGRCGRANYAESIALMAAALIFAGGFVLVFPFLFLLFA